VNPALTRNRDQPARGLEVGSPTCVVWLNQSVESAEREPQGGVVAWGRCADSIKKATHMRKNFLRTALAVGAGATLMLTGLQAPAKATVTSSATKAIDWLEGQMTANGHRLKSGYHDQNNNNAFTTFDDQGLTIDGLLAIASAGRADDAEAKATRDWMEGQVDNYVTGFDPGNSLYAGALGKAIVWAVVYDLDYNDLDGHDLEADLRGRMQSNGHFTDEATDFQSGDPVDFSNGIGDALDVLALAATDNGAPAVAVNYLLLQQCPAGGFREQLADTQCTDNTKATNDATSFAVMALGVVDPSDAVAAAIHGALTFFDGAQQSDGAFQAFAADNANSTGLAAADLRSAGDAPRANKAATFVKSVQLTSGADNGAILADKDGYDAATANGLDAESRTLAARATSQGVLALGLPSYPLIGEQDPVEPSTTMALSTSSVTTGGTITASGGGFLTGEKVRVTVASDPVTVGEPVANDSGVVSQSFALPSSVGAGSHTVTLLGETSGVTISAPLTVTAAQVATTTSTTVKTNIVRTGGNTTDQAQVALGLVGFGVALVLAARRRRIIYPFQK
jgi:hypothetical protein